MDSKMKILDDAAERLKQAGFPASEQWLFDVKRSVLTNAKPRSDDELLAFIDNQVGIILKLHQMGLTYRPVTADAPSASLRRARLLPPETSTDGQGSDHRRTAPSASAARSRARS